MYVYEDVRSIIQLQRGYIHKLRHGALQACPLPLLILHQLLLVTGSPFVLPLNLFAPNKGQTNKTVAFYCVSADTPQLPRLLPYPFQMDNAT